MTCGIRTRRLLLLAARCTSSSQRLGHAAPVVTLTMYAHVVPGSQRETADLFARLVAGARLSYEAEASERRHGPVQAGNQLL